MLAQAVFGGGGLILALILGGYCEYFLRKSVTADPKLSSHEIGGGGKELGVLERVLFFASFWIAEFALAAGWLAFKVAGKWASWQHVVRLNEEDQAERVKLSSRLLGRFLNGTLYNALCAAAGVLIGKIGSALVDEAPNRLALLAAASPIVFIVLIVLMLFLLFAHWPKYRKGDGWPLWSRTETDTTHAG
jgi:hypothetical protein